MILSFPKINQKGMSLLSLLVTLSVFSGLFLTFNQWGNLQRKSAVEIYQRFQAIQIVENQHQRRFLGLPLVNRTCYRIKFVFALRARKIRLR